LYTQKDADFLLEYIREHYAQPLTTDHLSRLLHICKTQLFALCKEYFSQSPLQLVIRRRLEVARELLVSTDDPISQIARLSGFGDAHYFCKAFKRFYQLSPTAYRQSHHQPPI